MVASNEINQFNNDIKLNRFYCLIQNKPNIKENIQITIKLILYCLKKGGTVKSGTVELALKT